MTREEDLQPIGRDSEVIQAIEHEGFSTFTFDGLRRMTGTHPETLSRTLERLEYDGMIVRSSEGYSITQKAKGTLDMRPAYAAEKRIPILHTYLPPGATAAAVSSTLKGKWFDRLRWVGVAEVDEGIVLKWVTDDGRVLIDAKLSGGDLDVEARVKKDSDFPSAVRAGHQLMARISRMYASSRPSGRTMLMPIGYFPSAM